MTPSSPRFFEVLGTRVSATDMESSLDWLQATVSSAEKSYIVFCTVSSILSARDDPAVKNAIDQAGLVTPDGMPLVWLGRNAGYSNVDRVYGPDFMLHVFAEKGDQYRHFFFGGESGVAEAMSARLKARFPDLVIAGTLSPPQVSGTEPDLSNVNAINKTRPDIVWVGLGHPKQELWMQTNRALLGAPVIAAVGAAFDFHSGRKREAPNWMKKNGLQWLHRLMSEPRRLAKRYVVGNSRFLYLLTVERLRGFRSER